MIRVENVEKSFDGLKALDGISLTVEKGSVYGLVGPNGAGKSTIIKHLTGVYKADKGEVRINNEPVYENPRIKEKISYIPDELFFINRASVKQMMKFYRNVYKDFDMERFEKLKEVFSSININKPICKLSKGMQKQAVGNVDSFPGRHNELPFKEENVSQTVGVGERLDFIGPEVYDSGRSAAVAQK